MDYYGRYLRYVYVTPPNGSKIHVNLEMVREGYAHAFIFSNNLKYRDQFFAAEAEAREAERIIWQRAEQNVSIIDIFANEGASGPNGEYAVIKNNENTTIDMRHWRLKDQSWHAYDFPPIEIPPGGEVRIYSGEGVDTNTSLYWDFGGTVWNDGGEVAFLRNPAGYLASFYEYGNRIQ